ncbi:MAG: O-antigen ligase family protein [Candidatus Latescibacterota bacterium]
MSQPRTVQVQRLPLAALAGVGAGVLLGLASLWQSSLLVLAGVGGAALVITAVRRAELALLGLLALTSTVLTQRQMPVIPIGVGNLYASDAITAGLLGLVVLRPVVDPHFRLQRSPLYWPLAAFWGLAMASAAVAMATGAVTLQFSIDEIRVVNGYLLLAVTANLLVRQQQVRVLVYGLYGLAAGVALAMLAQFALGPSLALFEGRVETLATEGRRFQGITRVLMPGQSLVLVAAMAAGAGLVAERLRARHLYLLLVAALTGGAVLLTFNRNFWVAVALGLALLFVVSQGSRRRRLIAWGAAAALAAVLVVLAAWQEPDARPARLIRAAADRFTSLVRSDTYQANAQSTLRWRDVEYRYALPQIALHPFLGVGLGNVYRERVPELDGYSADLRRYVHNGHVYLALKAGVPAYLAFLWLSLAYVWRGLRGWRHVRVPWMRGPVLGFCLAYLGVLVGSWTGPMTFELYWTPVLGVMMGAQEAILAGWGHARRAGEAEEEGAP